MYEIALPVGTSFREIHGIAGEALACLWQHRNGLVLSMASLCADNVIFAVCTYYFMHSLAAC